MRPVDIPKAPSSIPCATSSLIAASSVSVGAPSDIPITAHRTLPWGMSGAAFTAMPAAVRRAR